MILLVTIRSGGHWVDGSYVIKLFRNEIIFPQQVRGLGPTALQSKHTRITTCRGLMWQEIYQLLKEQAEQPLIASKTTRNMLKAATTFATGAAFDVHKKRRDYLMMEARMYMTT